MHIRNLRQELNCWLILKKVRRWIKLNLNAWLKPYIDMNRDPRRKVKNNFQKNFFNLVINALFGKTMENVRQNRDVKLATTERGRGYLVSKPKYHTAKFFAEYLLAIEMKKNADTYE